MDAIKATDTDLNLMDSGKNCEENKCGIQRKKREEKRRFEKGRNSNDDEGWAEPLL